MSDERGGYMPDGEDTSDTDPVNDDKSLESNDVLEQSQLETEAVDYNSSEFRSQCHYLASKMAELIPSAVEKHLAHLSEATPKAIDATRNAEYLLNFYKEWYTRPSLSDTRPLIVYNGGSLSSPIAIWSGKGTYIHIIWPVWTLMVKELSETDLELIQKVKKRDLKIQQQNTAP